MGANKITIKLLTIPKEKDEGCFHCRRIDYYHTQPLQRCTSGAPR